MPRHRPDGPQLRRLRGVWVIEWWDGDRRRRESTGEAAQAAALRYLADWQRDHAAVITGLTVADALDTYAKARAGRAVAPQRIAEAIVPLKAALGHLHIDQIGDAEWARYQRERVRKPHSRLAAAGIIDPRAGRPVAAGTLRREFNTLRAALRHCWPNGSLPPRLEAPADSRARRVYLTRDEARRLVEAAVSPHVKLFIALGFGTGARMGAILDLTWDRVDLTHGRIDYGVPGRPLTDKRRSVVPINTTVRAMLTEAAVLRAPDVDQVIQYDGGASGPGIRRAFGKAVRRAGLPPTVTPHAMKHSAASWMVLDGVPIETAAQLLATDDRTLRRTYVHFSPDHLVEAAQSLDFLRSGTSVPPTRPAGRAIIRQVIEN